MVLVIIPVLLIPTMLLVLLRRRSWMGLFAWLHLRWMRLVAMFRRSDLRPFMDLRSFMYLRRRCCVLLLRYRLRLLAALLWNSLPPLVRLWPGFYPRLRLGPFW